MQVSEDFFRFREKYGPVDKLETRHFLVGPKIAEEFEVTIEQGKTLHFKTLACSTDLTAEGEREVFFELNGQLRSVFIKDKSVAAEMALHPKADRSIAGHVGCVCQIIVKKLWSDSNGARFPQVSNEGRRGRDQGGWSDLSFTLSGSLTFSSLGSARKASRSNFYVLSRHWY